MLALDRLYLAQGVSFRPRRKWTGGNLSWVDANTGRIGGAIGAMPANIYAYRFASLIRAPPLLGLGYSADGYTTFLSARQSGVGQSGIGRSKLDFAATTTGKATGVSRAEYRIAPPVLLQAAHRDVRRFLRLCRCFRSTEPIDAAK